MADAVRVLAVITARGGSKGIPRKNIKLMAGKPLIAYTIEAGKQSKRLTRCIVSTDDEEIAAISREYGADVPFLRPKELAEDKSTSMSVVQHAVRWCKEHDGQEFDYVMILQPTSPLRTAKDVDASIALAQEKDADSVMSMYQLSDFSLQKIKRVGDDGMIAPYLPEFAEGKASTARQGLPKMYKRNCAVYLTKTSWIDKSDLFGERSFAYLMPEDRSVDINSMYDWQIAEALLSSV